MLSVLGFYLFPFFKLFVVPFFLSLSLAVLDLKLCRRRPKIKTKTKQAPNVVDFKCRYTSSNQSKTSVNSFKTRESISQNVTKQVCLVGTQRVIFD